MHFWGPQQSSFHFFSSQCKEFYQVTGSGERKGKELNMLKTEPLYFDSLLCHQLTQSPHQQNEQGLD